MFLNVRLFWSKAIMQGPNTPDDRLLVDSCSSLLIIIPVALLVLAYCCHPFWKRLLKALCEGHRRGAGGEGVPERRDFLRPLLGNPRVVLLPDGRIMILDGPPRPRPPLPPNYSYRDDIHEMEEGRISQGSKDPPCPTHDYLPPPSYESIFPPPTPVTIEPPSYTDAVTNVAFHLPESAV